MQGLSVSASPRVLDRLERTSEVLFGLIMVLTFTGSISVADAGEGQIREILVGALGCNFAWGIVDASMYLMACVTERGRTIVMLNAVRDRSDRKAAHALIRESLPSSVSALLTEPEIETMRERLSALPAPPTAPGVSRDDILGALAVFLLVFLSTLPVVIPFLVMNDALPALRMSHGIVLVMLLAAGWSLGEHAGRPGWRWGLTMGALGFALAGFTMALGG